MHPGPAQDFLRSPTASIAAVLLVTSWGLRRLEVVAHPRHYLRRLPSRSCRSRTLGAILSGIALPMGLPRTSITNLSHSKDLFVVARNSTKFTEASPRT